MQESNVVNENEILAVIQDSYELKLEDGMLYPSAFA